MIAAHAPDVIRPLLAAGVHVMAEKPACVNVEQFEELAGLADANGAHLMLALDNRISPSVADARRIIQSDGIGDLYAVRAVQVDDQTRIQLRLDDPDWTFQKKLAGGGHLSWLGIHRLDMLSYLVGEDIVEVSAMTAVAGGAPIDVEDLGIVTFKFAGGALGVLFSGYLMDQKGHNGFTVYGSEGWVRAHEGEADALEWRSISSAMAGSNDPPLRVRRSRRRLHPVGGMHGARLPGRDRSTDHRRGWPKGPASGARRVRLSGVGQPNHAVAEDRQATASRDGILRTAPAASFRPAKPRGGWRGFAWGTERGHPCGGLRGWP